MPIPSKFNSDGLLDVGTYNATFSDIQGSILILGDGLSPAWDKPWREELLSKAEILVKQLWALGINDVFLDGSFVEDKDHPNDIDGYFDPHLSMFNQTDIIKFGQIVSALNNLDPYKVWTWDPMSRRPDRGSGKRQLPMWHLYRVELYPHLGQGTGITDQYGNDQKFPAAFRQSRNGFKPKGIIKVIP